MPIQLGVVLAAVSMLSWGIGDFLIQRSSRKLGDWETLFFITAFGTVILIPFVRSSLPPLLHEPRNLAILLGCAVCLTIAAVLEIESFKRGKLSVVETLVPFEIPAASILAFWVLGDRVTPLELFLIIALVIGFFMVSFKGNLFSSKLISEKGVLLGLTGAAFMGVADFFLGWGSRVADPVLANFVVNISMAAISLAVIIARGRFRAAFKDLRSTRPLILAMAISDNVGWLAYAFAMSLIPIAVATGLSEASVVVAVLLGLFVNREKLQLHQKTGLVIAVVSAISLAFTAT